MFKNMDLLDLLKITDVVLIAAMVSFGYAVYAFTA